MSRGLGDVYKRQLLSPGDPATLVAADAHLRAVNDSPDGWRIGRALLSCAETPGDVLAPRVRVMGAAMLRAKAHADGFAMTPPDAASMTSELLAMLGTPEGSGELGPHLAQIAAAVATAGGAETLASLVNASISLAAPDSNGGWARVQDPNAPCPCGPNAHATACSVHVTSSSRSCAAAVVSGGCALTRWSASSAHAARRATAACAFGPHGQGALGS